MLAGPQTVARKDATGGAGEWVLEKQTGEGA